MMCTDKREDGKPERILILALPCSRLTTIKGILENNAEHELIDLKSELNNGVDSIKVQMDAIEKAFIAFVDVNQLLHSKLQLDQLIRLCEIQSVIILWHPNTEKRITMEMNQLNLKSAVNVHVPSALDMPNLLSRESTIWSKLFKHYPRELEPIFISADVQTNNLGHLLKQLGLGNKEVVTEAAQPLKAKTPAPVPVNVPEIFAKSYTEQHRFLILSEPRSGSTALKQLLSSHFVGFIGPEYGEPLNDENELCENSPSEIIDRLDQMMKECNKPAVGFKVFVGQLQECQIPLDVLLISLNIKTVFVLYRENCLQRIVSSTIANETDQWCHVNVTEESASQDVKTNIRVHLAEDYISRCVQNELFDWKWALRAVPSIVHCEFIEYNDLLPDYNQQLKKLMRLLGHVPEDYQRVYSTRQNPVQISDKLDNYNNLSSEIINQLRIDVPNVLNTTNYAEIPSRNGSALNQSTNHSRMLLLTNNDQNSLQSKLEENRHVQVLTASDNGAFNIGLLQRNLLQSAAKISIVSRPIRSPLTAGKPAQTIANVCRQLNIACIVVEPIPDNNWNLSDLVANWPLEIETLIAPDNSQRSCDELIRHIYRGEGHELKWTSPDPVTSSLLVQLNKQKMFLPSKEPRPPFVDWKYRVAEPLVTSEMKSNVMDSLDAGCLSSAGLWPKKLANLLCEIYQLPVAQPCSNGFSALVLALQAEHISEGAEVILPSLTMIACANAVHFVRATPVLVDIDPDDYNPTEQQVKNAITDKTRAVILSHTYGVPAADLIAIGTLCRARGIVLIEDISECVGVKFTDPITNGDRLLGTVGDYACASLYANKTVHGADGGFVLARNASVASQLKSLANHGFTPKFHFVHFQAATNSKINGVGAAIAYSCIKQLDRIMDHRQWIARQYRKKLAPTPVKLMPQCGPKDTPWVFGLECKTKEERTALRAHLASHGIETRDFFFPIHLQPGFNGIHIAGSSCLEATIKLSETGFYLPTHSNMIEEDIVFISSAIIQFFNKTNEKLSQVNRNQIASEVRIIPNSLQIQARVFDKADGTCVSHAQSGPYINAVQLYSKMDACMSMGECWDTREELRKAIGDCLNSLSGQQHEELSVCLKYLNSISNQELDLNNERPWVDIKDLNENPSMQQCMEIPSTTDYETCQLLIWLIAKYNVSRVLELGVWFGRMSCLAAARIKQLGLKTEQSNVVAVDNFIWFNWMKRFHNKNSYKPCDSYFDQFERFAKPFEDLITGVQLNLTGQHDLECSIGLAPFDLIILDFSLNSEDLEKVWCSIHHLLIPDHTIVLVNPVRNSTLPFLIKHADELKPLFKPKTVGKVFIFSPTTSVIEQSQGTCFEKKVRFDFDPAWDHLHQNAFGQAMLALKGESHDTNANVVFIPSVEQWLCDVDSPPTRRWIGIVHEAVSQENQTFYVPQVHRRDTLIKFKPWMDKCVGLLTLTELQRDHLTSALRENGYTFPVTAVKYPAVKRQLRSVNKSPIPDRLLKGDTVELSFIGSYARDYDAFFRMQVPSQFSKTLVLSDFESECARERCPNDVTVRKRLDDAEYELMLENTVPCFCLLSDGAANTLVLEAIVRNVPLLAPRMNSTQEYLGSDYPLFFDQLQPNLEEVLTPGNIAKAVQYLKSLDKSVFKIDNFVKSVTDSNVFAMIPALPSQATSLSGNSVRCYEPPREYDVTICLCSYRRTRNLPAILQALWNDQSYKGKVEIIIWNNNFSRSGILKDICASFMAASNEQHRLELIESSLNHYCVVRMLMPQLMSSQQLLICDDDIIPGKDFISFFMSARGRYPNDVLCVRGHRFLPHELRSERSAESFWTDYEHLRFCGDDAQEQHIHFVHADACALTKEMLHECGSVALPDASFALVDDYWMSFVLNHMFSRTLRKLSLCDWPLRGGSDSSKTVMTRTDDSDTVGVALYTRPEVMDARNRFYIHHMSCGWPTWRTAVVGTRSPSVKVVDAKLGAWDRPFVGFNTYSGSDSNSLKDLRDLGIEYIRVGAVCSSRSETMDFYQLKSDINQGLANLIRYLDSVKELGMKVLITLNPRVATPNIWRQVASVCAGRAEVIGYDLINEPSSKQEASMHEVEIGNEHDPTLQEVFQDYAQMIAAIRHVDENTPIVLESSFWAHDQSLNSLLANTELLQSTRHILVSCHFYRPRRLVYQHANKGRFEFPGHVTVYEKYEGDIEFWDVDTVKSRIRTMSEACAKAGVKLVIGETGVSRNVVGATEYLKAVLDSCREQSVPCLLYAWRDPDWESMDYEMGDVPYDYARIPFKHNERLRMIVDAATAAQK